MVRKSRSKRARAEEGYRAWMRKWLTRNAPRFLDECGEVNLTALVEAWDRETADGTLSLDPSHPVWEVASSLNLGGY